MGHSPWGHKESDSTEHLNTLTIFSVSYTFITDMNRVSPVL